MNDCAPLSQRKEFHRRDRGELYRLIAEAALDKPEHFAAHVANILRSSFPIKAASVYSYQPEADALTLRAQSGLSYTLYQSFELSIDSVAGDAVVRNEVIRCSDLRLQRNYRNNELIKEFQLRSLIVVPLVIPMARSTEAQKAKPTGGVCVYPESEEYVDEIADRLYEIAPFIALLYNASLDHRKIRLRQQLISRAGYSHEMGGLLHRVIHVFQDLFDVEAGSILLHDEKTNFLRLRSTTGLAEQTMMMRLINYGPDSTDLTYTSFAEDKTLVLGEQNFTTETVHPIEKTTHPRTNCILQPIREAAVQFERPPAVLGVLRGFNHYLCHEGVRRPTRFGWEEIKLLDFFAELTAVMIHFMKKGDQAKHDFERRMHGAKNNLQAAQFTLEVLDTAMVQLPSVMEPHSITNAISYIEDIRSQISRLDQIREPLAIGDVAFYKDIIVKIPDIVRRASHVYQVGDFRINNLKEAGFDQLPPISGNSAALLCVFRNLAENAVKYSDPRKRKHTITLSFKVVNDTIIVMFANDGIRILEKDKDMIFVEGFRGDDAIVRYPSSSGFGLSDSRELMQKMKGNLLYLPKEPMTTFCVEIPLSV